MICYISISERLRLLSSLTGASIASFAFPVMPSGLLCTAMVFADFVSARLLARRVRRRFGHCLETSTCKFSSRRFGNILATLTKVYALLLLSHGVDLVIIGADSAVSMLRFSAALVCFWQFWSILENEASANDAPWARVAQRILVDKASRHLGVDLSALVSPDGRNADTVE